MLSRVIKIDAKGQPLIFELQDGIAIPPTFGEFEKREPSRQYFILRNIKDQGITAFWASSHPSLPEVFARVFPQSLSEKIIEHHQLRSLRTPREIKPHEQGINPVFVNLGKIGQDVPSDVKPIRLDANLRYLWLHNAAGEMILGVEHIWDYASLCEFHEQTIKVVELMKKAIIENYIMPYLEAEDKMKLDKQQLAAKQKAMKILAKDEARRGILALESIVGKKTLHEEVSAELTEKDKLKKPELEKKSSEDMSAKINKMLKIKGGLGHASLSPVYKSDGNLESLSGAAYMAGELSYTKEKWVLTNKSGRFFSENDSEKSNTKLLKADADFLHRRSGETIHIALEKNKLDPQFLWHKALNVKMEEFEGDKVKIAFNCISKVYKFNSSYTTARKLEKKIKHAEKESIFNQLFPANDTESSSEERFVSAIVYMLDTILSYEKTPAVRVGLVKQIQYMIEHQLSESLPAARKTALLATLHTRQRELWVLGEDGSIVVNELPEEKPKLRL